MTHAKDQLDEILDALMLEEPEPSYAVLERWIERYPEHRNALAEYFVTWAVQYELADDTPVDDARLANLAVSHALDILHRRDVAAKQSPRAETSPRLIASAGAAGLSEQDLATQTGLETSIIAKLDLRRLIGIPQACCERIARALGVGVAQIEAMVTGAPLASAGVHYKARRKPAPKTESFAEAIRSSSLNENEKTVWLEAVATEQSRSE